MHKRLFKFFLLIALISTPVLSEEANKAENVKENVPEIKNLPAEVKPKGTAISKLLNSGGELIVANNILAKDVLKQIYEPKGYKTLYFTDNAPNANYEKAMNFLSLADENGLSRQFFDLNPILERVNNKEKDKITDEYIAQTDLLITHFIVQMIVEIGNGHKIPDELQLQTFFKRPVRVVSAPKAFNEFLEADDTEKLIEKYSPKNPQYALLKKALQKEIKEAGNRDYAKIDYDGDVKPGEKNRVIPDIRAKIDPASTAFGKPKLYDDRLAGRVAELQRKFNMEDDDAVITKQFIEFLNAYDNNDIYRLKANMERYRWLPDKMEDNHLEVNLPSYRLYAYRGGKEDFNMGTIVGKDAHKTPIMSTVMTQFVLNPYWNVPKEYSLRNMVPLLKQSPDYIEKQNFELLANGPEGWHKIKQSDVDWNSVNKDNYHYQLRQLPGNINVLGPIKFVISNPYDIYLHSTSEPWLFTNDSRGYSSGCIRVEDPTKLAKYVIDIGGAAITQPKFNELYKAYYSKDGRPLAQKPEMNDRWIKLKNPIPIYITYVSVIANDDGSVEEANDIYDLDLKMSEALKLQ